MTITGEKALRVAAWAAALFWTSGIVSIVRDVYFPEPYSKGGWMTGFVMLTAFCGTAFYLMMTPPLFRFWSSERSCHQKVRWPAFVWALSPVPLVLIALGLVLYLIATRT